MLLVLSSYEWNNVDNNIVKKCSSTLFIANMGVAGHYD